MGGQQVTKMPQIDLLPVFLCNRRSKVRQLIVLPVDASDLPDQFQLGPRKDKQRHYGL